MAAADAGGGDGDVVAGTGRAGCRRNCRNRRPENFLHGMEK